ncbi:hypothetical protein CKAH01_06934 [Colletotrichum kahawae]|uniref:Uncharacterized protein n=1 Tax=Colletotrichum kahawae TaxID=34407 RepID=A0AAE0D2Z2_COLKA|nr:hypothetical protein CKAH01_06934 [Colletotrichum kahawae]
MKLRIPALCSPPLISEACGYLPFPTLPRGKANSQSIRTKAFGYLLANAGRHHRITAKNQTSQPTHNRWHAVTKAQDDEDPNQHGQWSNLPANRLHCTSQKARGHPPTAQAYLQYGHPIRPHPT